jgi:anti-anti-sigma factor
MKTHSVITGDAIVVSLEGKIDYDTQDQIKVLVDSIMAKPKSDSVPKRIIFNCESLEFVGSMGITPFLKALSDIEQSWDLQPEYRDLKSEFHKLMKYVAPQRSDFETIDVGPIKPILNQ